MTGLRDYGLGILVSAEEKLRGADRATTTHRNCFKFCPKCRWLLLSYSRLLGLH